MESLIRYPRLLRRLRAGAIDGIIVSVTSVSLVIFISMLNGPGFYSAMVGGCILFLSEPLLISLTGGTLGQHLMGLRVVNKHSLKNINLIISFIRYFLKILFSVFSIISIFITRQHQAVHDVFVGSTVILKAPQIMPSFEALTERQTQQPGYAYPSTTRRASVIIFYNLMLLIFLGAASTYFLSEQCNLDDHCSDVENMIASILFIVWFIGMSISIRLGWKGLLYGGRRRLKDDF